MTALAHLEALVDEVQKGIIICHKHPNSVTKNSNLATLLTGLNIDLNHSIKEILKGNVK